MNSTCLLNQGLIIPEGARKWKERGGEAVVIESAKGRQESLIEEEERWPCLLSLIPEAVAFGTTNLSVNLFCRLSLSLGWLLRAELHPGW